MKKLKFRILNMLIKKSKGKIKVFRIVWEYAMQLKVTFITARGYERQHQTACSQSPFNSTTPDAAHPHTTSAQHTAAHSNGAVSQLLL